jgi:ABC-type dipeptide/oligopeptide/nickel transport system permease component
VRSSEYVVRRIAFALATIFVAVTLNFVIFRAAPGDATTAMRCLSCTDEVRLQVRQELGLDKSKFQQYVISQAARARELRALVPEPPAGAAAALQPLANTLPMLLLGTFFSMVLGLARESSPGGAAPGRRRRRSGAASRSSLPTQWLGIMLILNRSGRPHGISDPTCRSPTQPVGQFSDRLRHGA